MDLLGYQQSGLYPALLSDDKTLISAGEMHILAVHTPWRLHTCLLQWLDLLELWAAEAFWTTSSGATSSILRSLPPAKFRDLIRE